MNTDDAQVISHGQAKVLSQKMKDAREERYMETCRKRLDKLITTKMKTSFIGALAAFEEAFAFLWDESTDKVTVSTEEMFDLWINARTAVLNNGNNQLRAVRSELSNHVVNWNRYQLNFKVKPQGEDDE